MQNAPLVEGGSGAPGAPGTTGAVDPEMDRVATVDERPRQGVDVRASGPFGEPLIEIPTSTGSIELGYQDITLALLAVDLGIRLLEFMGGR